jgi:acyl carrier protein
MERQEIFEKVRLILVDALAVDEDEVTPEAALMADLGAESIDLMDIAFKLEQVFKFKIEKGELFPEGVQSDPQFVKEGKVTPLGLQRLKDRLPHFDFSKIEADPTLKNVGRVFTVDAVVNFVARKVSAVKV